MEQVNFADIYSELFDIIPDMGLDGVVFKKVIESESETTLDVCTIQLNLGECGKKLTKGEEEL